MEATRKRAGKISRKKRRRAKSILTNDKQANTTSKRGKIQMIAHKKWHFLAKRRRCPSLPRLSSHPSRRFGPFRLEICYNQRGVSGEWLYIFEYRYRRAISNHSKCCRYNARHIRVYCQMVIILFIDFYPVSLSFYFTPFFLDFSLLRPGDSDWSIWAPPQLPKPQRELSTLARMSDSPEMAKPAAASDFHLRLIIRGRKVFPAARKIKNLSFMYSPFSCCTNKLKYI